MRLVIFGASGGTGRLLAGKALAAGHDVVAYVRNPGKLPAASERLQVVTGQLSDPAAIRAAVGGADAVVAVLSQPVFGGSADLPIASGTRTIVTAMQDQGVRRLVYCWGPSIALPHHTWNRTFAVVFGLIKALPGTRVFTAESAGAGEAVRSSGLGWTIVAVARPVDKPAAGKLKVRTGTGQGDKVGMTATSRDDLADFLLQEATGTRYLHQSVLVSN